MTLTTLWCVVLGHKDERRTNDRKETYWVCRRCGHVSERSRLADYGPSSF